MMFLKAFLEKWSFAIGVAIITFVTFSGVAANVHDKGVTDFQAAKREYDEEMNKYFNDKLEKLVLMMENDPKFFEKKAFQSPVDANGNASRNLCTPENVSSYCVSMGAVDIYIAYVRDLSSLKGNLAIDPNKTINQLTLDEVLGDTTTRNSLIDKEIAEAEDIMEATVAAYNEFRTAYPMHLQYEQVIENLVAYRRGLRDLQVQVNRFPSKFINTTTLECR